MAEVACLVAAVVACSVAEESSEALVAACLEAAAAHSVAEEASPEALAAACSEEEEAPEAACLAEDAVAVAAGPCGIGA